MATPKQLVSAVATALYVPEATVTVHDRNLSVAGLRSVGGRGRAAAKVTTKDAANLLIATAASRNVKDSVQAIFQYGSLVSTHRWTSRFNPPELAVLTSSHTLAEAVTALIHSAVTGTFTQSGTRESLRELFVTFYGPIPECEIKVLRLQGRDSLQRYVHPRAAPTGSPVGFGLRYSTYFTHRTIIEVAKIFSL